MKYEVHTTIVYIVKLYTNQNNILYNTSCRGLRQWLQRNGGSYKQLRFHHVSTEFSPADLNSSFGPVTNCMKLKAFVREDTN